MANERPIVQPGAWELALNQYQEAKEKFEAEAEKDPASEDTAHCYLRMDEREKVLMELPAPDPAAVIEKLRIVFGESLFWGDLARDTETFGLYFLRRLARSSSASYSKRWGTSHSTALPISA